MAGPRDSWPRRLAWLVGLWAAGVLVLSALAWLLRQAMQAVGLSG